MSMEKLKDTEKFVVYKKDEDLPKYVSKFVSWVERFVFNRISKRVNHLLGRLEDGTVVGQITFWNGTAWVPTETSEAYWDDTNKIFVVKRVYKGGITP